MQIKNVNTETKTVDDNYGHVCMDVLSTITAAAAAAVVVVVAIIVNCQSFNRRASVQWWWLMSTYLVSHLHSNYIQMRPTAIIIDLSFQK